MKLKSSILHLHKKEGWTVASVAAKFLKCAQAIAVLATWQLPSTQPYGKLKSPHLVYSLFANYVCSEREGIVTGQAIAPLYRSVPQAAKNDPELYALLSLIDALRVGRVREQPLAEGELKNRLLTV